MKIRKLLLTAGLTALCGCALTHYESADEKPKDEILISTNVPAQILKDGEVVSETATEHVLKNVGMNLTVRAAGYNDVELLVYPQPPKEKNMTSHESSVSWSSRQTAGVSSDVSDVGANAATTSPTSTVMLPVNLVKMVLGIVWMPFDFATQFNPLGYYYAYGDNEFHVNLAKKGAAYSVWNAYEEQVEEFILKNKAEVMGQKGEYIAALVKFSGMTRADVVKVLKANPSPESAARAFVEKMRAVRGE
ncbi:MAG TPA: hypothetical protein DD624_00735 [Alphaproteobacteria bacterium]|nr:hypothetical protein [Alphaproteobacteria bacterium]